VSRRYAARASTTSTAVQAPTTIHPMAPQPWPPVETWLACTSLYEGRNRARSGAPDRRDCHRYADWLRPRLPGPRGLRARRSASGARRRSNDVQRSPERHHTGSVRSPGLPPQLRAPAEIVWFDIITAPPSRRLTDTLGPLPSAPGNDIILRRHTMLEHPPQRIILIPRRERVPHQLASSRQRRVVAWRASLQPQGRQPRSTYPKYSTTLIYPWGRLSALARARWRTMVTSRLRVE
jgi:hypothetical protein